jgi:hypothetical protein|eukprot:COSAG01_NODE_64_length_29509_cov_1035.985209_12_plen_80_part_00
MAGGAWGSHGQWGDCSAAARPARHKAAAAGSAIWGRRRPQAPHAACHSRGARVHATYQQAGVSVPAASAPAAVAGPHGS